MSAADNNSKCRIIPGTFTVQHWDCSDYGDKTVTDIRTGKIVSPR